MFNRKTLPLWLIPLLLFFRAPAAHAQFAVIDVASVAQLIQQVQLIEKELATAQSELAQAQATYQAMTGNRGMQNLLSGITRNYLPTSAAQLQQLASGQSSSYPALATEVQRSVSGNAILTPTQVATLSSSEQSELNAGRQNAALLGVVAGTALSTTSTRFSSLQQLISAIPSATDAKGALDLQARISAEQAMLANDQSKLQALYRTAQAQEWTRNQRAREQAIEDIGSFRNLPPMGL